MPGEGSLQTLGSQVRARGLYHSVPHNAVHLVLEHRAGEPGMGAGVREELGIPKKALAALAMWGTLAGEGAILLVGFFGASWCCSTWKGVTLSWKQPLAGREASSIPKKPLAPDPLSGKRKL